MGNGIGILPGIEFDRIQRKNSQPEVDVLRRQLKQLKAWPEAGDQFLDLLPQIRQHASPVTESDKEWIASVIDDVIKGVDIGSRYPAFFHNLITNSHLRRIFLDELERKTS